MAYAEDLPISLTIQPIAMMEISAQTPISALMVDFVWVRIRVPQSHAMMG